MIDSTVKRIFAEAYLYSQVISITYRKQSDKKVVRRKIEPYEFKDGYLWGYDITPSLPNKKKSIKKWISKNIINMNVEKEKFKKRKF